MLEQQSGEFKRQLVIKPGHHWPGGNGRRDYGNGSVTFTFYLTGPKGAVECQFGTNWMPEAARNDVAMRRAIHGLRPDTPEEYGKPRGHYLGYHSPTPKFEGQESSGKCDFLGGSECYRDGSYCAADNLIEGFLNGGDDWVWDRLEAYYRSLFEGAEYPSFDPVLGVHPDDRPKTAA